jgi:hypothetical protein
MKLEKIKNGSEVNFKFIAETEKEKRMLGDLRQHYFYGMDDDGTFPQYDGIEYEDNFVTAMKFKYNQFK